MPWAFEDGMTWMGWPDTYDDMQVKIHDRILEYSDQIGFTVAPVGWAWKQVLEQNDYPLHYLHREDWSHPTPEGSYLMACVIYSTIFVESTTGNSYYSSVSETEASFFQEIGSNTVLNDTLLWKVTSYHDTTFTSVHSPGDYNPPGDFLSQNYPNPFDTHTNIEYAVDHNTEVEIILYDISGKRISTLYSGCRTRGEYVLHFDSGELPGGIYLYELRTSTSRQVRKMQVVR
jgi:hypothetical protein